MSGPKGKEENINMKIRVFEIAVAFAFITNGNAQNTDVKIDGDTARLRVVYDFSQNNYLNKSLSRADTMALDIGDRLSVFYDMTVPNKTIDKFIKPEQIKSLSIEYTRSDDLENIIIGKNEYQHNVFKLDNYISTKTYKNREQNRVYTLDQNQANGEDISIFLSEDLLPQQWVIGSDTCRVLGYPCHKATTKFRGREYDAYFTQELPVNDGPWKLYGLPGLILEAKTSDGIFHVKAIGIQKIKNTPIDISYGKNTEICKELNQFYKFIRNKRNSYLIEDKGNVIIYEKPLSKDIIFMEEENKD
ncbi:GLPGLI family protein [Petrimonas sulfuriphila]|jgi:GLPGLI family protein|uniref:GLPGLI family protein n=2 Tax=Dysgonomonadaceae TaxID=2005520 RepID=UPI002B3CC842|nr:GLPGLI family protein [Petrimonas sp.]